MIVVSHQHVGVNLPAGLLTRLTQRLRKALPVPVILENLLPVVATRHDVIHRSRILNAKRTCHCVLTLTISRSQANHRQSKNVIILGLTFSCHNSSTDHFPLSLLSRNFVCGILTHAAQESDEAGAQKMQAEQAAMGLEKPSALYVDGAYVSGQRLAEAASEGRRLVGPAAHSPQNNQGRFTAEQFQIDVERRQAICPAGQPNTQCSRLEEQQGGKVSFRFEWSTHCQGCP